MSAPHPRPVRAGSDLRLLRAALFAAVCVVLAAVGHAVASCATVPLWAVGTGFLGTLMAVLPLAGRERSPAGIAALLAVGQTVLHTLFGLGQHTAAASTGSAAAHGRLSDAELVAQAAKLLCGAAASAISPSQAQRILADARIHPAATAMHDPADALSTTAGSTASLPSLPMLMAHVLAALAAGWLLRRGDMALVRIGELSAVSAQEITEGALVRALRGALALVRALLAGLPCAPGTTPRPPRTAPRAATEPRTAALQHTVIRRGPPGAAAALVLAA